MGIENVHTIYSLSDEIKKYIIINDRENKLRPFYEIAGSNAVNNLCNIKLDITNLLDAKDRIDASYVLITDDELEKEELIKQEESIISKLTTEELTKSKLIKEIPIKEMPTEKVEEKEAIPAKYGLKELIGKIFG
jgi:hypothetical protein